MASGRLPPPRDLAMQHVFRIGYVLYIILRNDLVLGGRSFRAFREPSTKTVDQCPMVWCSSADALSQDTGENPDDSSVYCTVPRKASKITESHHFSIKVKCLDLYHLAFCGSGFNCAKTQVQYLKDEGPNLKTESQHTRVQRTSTPKTTLKLAGPNFTGFDNLTHTIDFDRTNVNEITPYTGVQNTVASSFESQNLDNTL